MLRNYEKRQCRLEEREYPECGKLHRGKGMKLRERSRTVHKIDMCEYQDSIADVF